MERVAVTTSKIRHSPEVLKKAGLVFDKIAIFDEQYFKRNGSMRLRPDLGG